MLVKKENRNSAAKKMVFVLAAFLVSLTFASYVGAQNVVPQEFAGTIALPATDIRIIIAQIIRVVLGLVGIIAVLIVLYGGYVWMTAAGNSEKVDKAKKILLNGSIGLLIVILAFSITQFILGRLQEAIGVLRPGVTLSGGLGGALGGGIIESHYPPRGGTDIPRNTKIIVTFKEPIDSTTICNITDSTKLCAGDDLKTGNVEIRPSSAATGTGLAAKVTTVDNKTFVFAPDQLLGSADANIWHTVSLGRGIKKLLNQKPAFGNISGWGYTWDFQVSTKIDITPPQIESVFPAPDSSNPRNVVIQINFNEAIDPTTVTGKVELTADQLIKSGTFKNIKVGYNIDSTTKAPRNFISGSFSISNQYRTVEFISDKPCEGISSNSCGDPVFCLPGPDTLDVLIKAATLSLTNPDNKSEAKTPYNGVVDVAGNSLDGNGDGKAQGPALAGADEWKQAYDLGLKTGSSDDAVWPFSTTGQIDLTPPKLNSINPDIAASNISLKESLPVFNSRLPISAQFDKIMMSGTLKPDSGYNDGYCDCSADATKCPVNTTCDSLSKKCVSASGNNFACAYDIDCRADLTDLSAKGAYCKGTREYVSLEKAVNIGYYISGNYDYGRKNTTVNLSHDPLALGTPYGVKIGSGLKDAYQNCFYPSAGTEGAKCNATVAEPYCCQGVPSATKCSF